MTRIDPPPSSWQNVLLLGDIVNISKKAFFSIYQKTVYLNFRRWKAEPSVTNFFGHFWLETGYSQTGHTTNP